jgi:hypothetical protein
MANNKIQIRRSVSNSVVTGLANGELAYTQNTNLLYIGAPDGSSPIIIGGLYNFGTLTANAALVANSTSGIDKIVVANLVATRIWANGADGSGGAVLSTNSTGGLYWGTAGGGGSVTSVDSANGIAGGPISTSGTLYAVAGVGVATNSSGINVLANNGISANSTGVFAVAGVGAVTNSTGIHVLANSGIVSNSTGVFVRANNGIAANATGVYVTAGPTLTVNATGVHINTTGTVQMRDLTLTGNLNVSGTLTTIDATNLIVKDNFIQLADQQDDGTSFLDAVDSGFFSTAGNTSVQYYSGLARVASLSSNTNPYFKLFSTSAAPNTTTISTSVNIGTLQSFLSPWGAGGAFVVNATAISITANGTVSASLAANSLSLTTALIATSGGTGYNTYTAGDILVGNSGNAFTKMSIGTDGAILQVSSSSIVWGGLDGGTF